MFFSLIIQVVVLLYSVIVHEYAHGWMAGRHGDDTAKVMGRLTFNPLSHIDPVGTILLPALAILTQAPIFGWAKPVPVNPYNLNNPQKDMIWVALAGPLSNILLAVCAAFLMWFIRTYSVLPLFVSSGVYGILKLILVINVILPVFNLFPVPPLDGSKVVMGILPREAAYRYSMIEPYGFIIIIMMLATGMFSSILGPIINLIINSLGGGASYF